MRAHIAFVIAGNSFAIQIESIELFVSARRVLSTPKYACAPLAAALHPIPKVIMGKPGG